MILHSSTYSQVQVSFKDSPPPQEEGVVTSLTFRSEWNDHMHYEITGDLGDRHTVGYALDTDDTIEIHCNTVREALACE